MLRGGLAVKTGHLFFGYFDQQKLVAVSTVKCYHGHWFLRACYVKPSYRGQGIQRKLIKARLEFLRRNTNAKTAKVRVEPSNLYSLRNVLKHGFKSNGNKVKIDGIKYDTYELVL